MQKESKLSYEDFLHHKPTLIATFEVALMDACEKFKEKHGSLAQLDWFSSNPDKHIQQSNLHVSDGEVLVVED